MPRHNPPLRHARHQFSSGICMMLVGAISLLDSESGDLNEDIAFSLLTLGSLVYTRELKDRRKSAVLNGRYGARGPYHKDRTRDFIDSLIEQSSGRFFKMWFRVNRTSFFRLLGLIQDDPVFISRGRKPQAPPLYQLATYLIRYGTEPGVKVATLLQLAEGTIYNHSSRVVRAIRNIRHLYLSWPTREERRQIKTGSQAMGFPGAVGVVDASYIPLIEKPRQNPMSYRSRKKTWALNAQAIVNFQGKFISYDLGWPGCVNDVTIWKRSHFWMHRDDYLDRDEWIMADKGYPVSRYLISLFYPDECVDPDPLIAAARKRWNKALSSERIVVEHAFGWLKGRFPFLAGARGRDISNICRVIESLMVVHNILLTFGDEAEDIENINILEVLQAQHDERPQEADFQPSRNIIGTNMRAIGVERRRQLVDWWVQNGFNM